MALQLSIPARNARLEAVETTLGVSPILILATGAPPANCAAAATGTTLATFTLPSDWMAAAASGAKAKSGTWQDLLADATGVAAHFRIYESTGVTCHLQGTVTMPGGGGDMILDNTNIAVNQQIVVSSFSLNDANS